MNHDSETIEPDLSDPEVREQIRQKLDSDNAELKEKDVERRPNRKQRRETERNWNDAVMAYLLANAKPEHVKVGEQRAAQRRLDQRRRARRSRKANRR